MSTKATEREICVWLSQEINRILDQGGYPFQESTGESSLTGTTSLFPDILIWKNREAKDCFALMEIKPPGKIESREKLPEKASRAKVDYIITWNFTEATLFSYADGTSDEKKTYPTNAISNLEEWLREDKKIILRKCLKDFLDDLRELSQKGHFYQFPLDKHFFIKLLHDSLDRLYPYFIDHVADAMRDRKQSDKIMSYLVEQGIPAWDKREAHEQGARFGAYGLLTKIIFYLTIRRHFRDLPDIISESEKARSLGKVISRAFASARKIDWQAVFDEDNPIDEIGVPQNCHGILIDLLKKLAEYKFGELKEDIIGEIFQNLIPPDRRHLFGQYFTREDLVDFIIGFVAQSPQGNFCDPTCGSGTFLNRLYSRLKWQWGYGKGHIDLLSQIWGVDIAKFPAELATINLFTRDVGNYRNFPRVQVKDFFEVRPGQELDFPPPQAAPGRFDKIKEKIPLFAGMVGNFPFIRQEQIEKVSKGNKAKITRAIQKDWTDDYRDIFKNGDLKLSGQADIYAYLYLHAAKFVAPDGRMGFITSNSYLDVGYGYELKKFFLSKFKIIAVVASWAEPWFDSAAVNTVFTILERCDDAQERNEHYVKFVKVKKKLEDLIPYPDLDRDEQQRWSYIDKLVRKIEYAKAPEGKYQLNKDTQYIPSVEDDDFRIRPIKQSFLLEELNERKHSAKWGKYLRAPDVYFEILERGKDHLVPLDKLADIRRGYTTGINEFFYVQPTGQKPERKKCLNVKNSRGWVGDIEQIFLKPVIKSPKEADKIIIDPRKLKFKLFMCNMSKADLKKSGYLGALKYIQWGEKQKTGKRKGRPEGVPWPEVPSVQNRPYWFVIEEAQEPLLLMKRFVDKRFYFPSLPKTISAGDTFFVAYPKKTERQNLLLSYLNSTVYSLFVEIHGRANMGDGVLTFYGPDIESTSVLSLQKVQDSNIEGIRKCFSRISKRRIHDVEKELRLEDRRAFDASILEAIGLNPDEYLPRIYDGLKELVRERLALPKMRKASAKTKIDISTAEAKEHVEREILPDGLESFPGAFIPQLKKPAMMEIPTGDQPLKIGHHFFGKYEMIDESGTKIYEANGLDMAEFIVCSYKPNDCLIAVPRDNKIIIKALSKYKKYIKDTCAKLAQRAFSICHDHDMAHRIALEILRENGYSGDFELSE